MLPAAYTTSAAAVLVVGGLLSCFAGYRLFRLVLGIYGFIAGAAVTTSVMGATNMFALAVAAVVGGVVGAILMVAAYFIGVGLIGAGMASLALHWGWRFFRETDPPTAVLVIVAVLGALGALSIVRYVVVFGTALSGSWTMILGALAIAANRSGAMPASEVWTLYPLHPTPYRWWIPIVWLVVAFVGVVVQLKTTTKLAAKRASSKK